MQYLVLIKGVIFGNITAISSGYKHSWMTPRKVVLLEFLLCTAVGVLFLMCLESAQFPECKSHLILDPFLHFCSICLQSFTERIYWSVFSVVFNSIYLNCHWTIFMNHPFTIRLNENIGSYPSYVPSCGNTVGSDGLMRLDWKTLNVVLNLTLNTVACCSNTSLIFCLLCLVYIIRSSIFQTRALICIAILQVTWFNSVDHCHFLKVRQKKSSNLKHLVTKMLFWHECLPVGGVSPQNRSVFLPLL